MPSQQSVEEARASNAALDEALRSNGVVDRELYLRLCDMHSYQAASTVAWVEGRLKMLRGRIDHGQSLALFVPAYGGLVASGGRAENDRAAATREGCIRCALDKAYNRPPGSFYQAAWSHERFECATC